MKTIKIKTIKNKKNTKNRKINKSTKKNLNKHKSKKKYTKKYIGGAGAKRGLPISHEKIDGLPNYSSNTNVNIEGLNNLNTNSSNDMSEEEEIYLMKQKFNEIFGVDKESKKYDSKFYIFDIEYIFGLLRENIQINFQDTNNADSYVKYDEYMNNINNLKLIYQYLTKRHTELKKLDDTEKQRRINDLCRILYISTNQEYREQFSRDIKIEDTTTLLLLLEILSIIKIELDVNNIVNAKKGTSVKLHEMILKYLNFKPLTHNNLVRKISSPSEIENKTELSYNNNSITIFRELIKLLKIYNDPKYKSIINNSNNNIVYQSSSVREV